MALEINDKLIAELIKRQMDEQEMAERFAPEPSPSVPELSTLTPKQALLLGGLGDAASTYTFLKRGKGVEGNAMLAFTKNKPLPTAMGALGGTLSALALHKLLSKKYPKLADTLAGGLGAYQMGLTSENFKNDVVDSAGVTNSMLSDVITRSRKR